MLAARPDSSAMRRRSCPTSSARARRLARTHLALEQLREADDAGQRIVQLVRHAGDQLTNRRQLLGLKQLRLRRLQALDRRRELGVGLAQLFAHVLQPPRRTNFFGHVLRDLHDRSAGGRRDRPPGNVVTLRICSFGQRDLGAFGASECAIRRLQWLRRRGTCRIVGERTADGARGTAAAAQPDFAASHAANLGHRPAEQRRERQVAAQQPAADDRRRQSDR